MSLFLPLTFLILFPLLFNATLSLELRDGNECDPFPYDLDNECRNVLLSEVNFNHEEQDLIFSEISVFISDVRMFPSICRRSLIWLLCNLAFPSCIQGVVCHSIDLSSCFQVEENCMDSYQSFCSQTEQNRMICDGLASLLNCSSFFSSPPTSTSSFPLYLPLDEMSIDQTFEQIEQCDPSTGMEGLQKATEEPIEVTTCLISQNVTIDPCCTSPLYVKDKKTGECVVSCPQYDYTKEKEETLGIVSFVLLWISTFIFFLSVFPSFFIPELRQFPGYVGYIVSFTTLLFLHSQSWAFYVGGPKVFVCHSEQNFFVAEENVSGSPRCFIQATIGLIASMNISYWQMIFALCILSYPLSRRYPFFARFRSNDKKIEFFTHLVGLVLTTIVTIFVIFMAVIQYALRSDFTSSFQFSFPGIYACVFSPRLYGFFILVIQILLGVVAFFLLVIAIFFLIRISWYILYEQLRSILYLAYYFLASIGMSLLVYVAGVELTRPVALSEYMTCVASHPKSSSPPCDQQTANYFPEYLILVILIFSWVGVTNLILYLSHPAVINWYVRLVKERVFSKTYSYGYSEIGA